MEFNYDDFAQDQVIPPTSDKETFLKSVNVAIQNFESNEMFKKLDRGTLGMSDYHKLLLTLFHQTYNGPSTFALAGANCEASRPRTRDYLLKHADEEKDHWQWVLGDLKGTAYSGADPRASFPGVATQAYLAYAYYLALRFPLGRLGMAMVLEGIGGKFGTTYGSKLASYLKLQKHQAMFFLMHGELDAGHSEEVLDFICTHPVSSQEWAHLAQVAKVTGVLYKNMYDEAATLNEK